MSNVTLQLAATPSDGVKGYWITVHDTKIKMVNDKGSVDLESPGSYILVWHFIGKEGETLAISGVVAGKTVVQVKKSTIPAREIAGAGIVRFQV